MPKFIDDPFKKVSYSFRIEERLLEDIKSYSEATNRKLPETFNYLLKLSLNGINVNNTYLKGYEGEIINIPFMKYQRHYTYGVDNVITDTWYSYTKGATDLTNFNFEGLLYEVKKIPNNLDSWVKGFGYTSKKDFTAHEGVCLLIVPELILYEKTCITQESILNCLKYIYFELREDSTLKVTSISYKDCFRKLKEAGNDKELVKFKKIDKKFYRYTMSFVEYYKDSPVEENPEIERKFIYSDLKIYASKYNDGNIISVDDKTIISTDNGESLEEDTDITSNDYLNDIDKLKKELEAKNNIIKEYEEKTKGLENTLKEIDRRLTELESKKTK